MSRVRRSARAAIAVIAAIAGAVLAIPRIAAAEECDAGASCADEDHDGFAACGCPWSGTPCDCDDHDPTRYPNAPEACDSTKDNDCNGTAGNPCAVKHGCLGSVCVPQCIPLDDFGCVVGSTFASQPSGQCLCAPEDCTIFGCPPGLTCDDAKKCVPNCHSGVRCPQGQLCRGFGCVDPCAEVTCPAGAACEEGRCVPSCACQPGAAGCPPGKTCDQTGSVPTCVDPTCVGVRCPNGLHCEDGHCVDDCSGVVCPTDRVCEHVSVNGGLTHASCVDLCSPNPCKPGFVCLWRTGSCMPRPIGDGGLAAPPELVDPLEVAGAGWLCSASGLARASAVTLFAGVALFGLLVIRRRRRRSE